MIKNIYDKKNKYYQHEYFCDYCFKEIEYGEILRNEEAIKRNKIDLCSDCKNDWDSFEEINKELGKGEIMIKNIYDKDRKHYKHKYYCDMCFNEISEFGEICRNHRAIKFDIFDLCNKCEYLMKEN